MKKKMLMLALGGALAGLGCETQGEEAATGDEIESEMRDLEQARQAAPQEAQQLEQDLAQAEQRVTELEEQLARARHGVTDEVVQEREDLEAALNEQETEVTQEMRHAAELAEEHNQEARSAQQALAQGERVTDVEARVQTETQVETAQPDVRERTLEEQIQVERTELPDERQAERAQPSQRQEG